MWKLDLFSQRVSQWKRYAIHRIDSVPCQNMASHTDYCMTSRPTINDDFIILSDRRLVKMLYNIFLVKEEDMPRYLKMLEMWRKDLKKNNAGRGAMKTKYEYDKEKGLAIGMSVKDFYENLDSRRELHSSGFMREVVKVGLNKKKKKKKKKSGSSKKGSSKGKDDDTPEKKPVDALDAVLGSSSADAGDDKKEKAEKDKAIKDKDKDKDKDAKTEEKKDCQRKMVMWL